MKPADTGETGLGRRQSLPVSIAEAADAGAVRKAAAIAAAASVQ